ncbi:major facilitator superfamily domain-containing protein [Roridomyces roridus]|uniref:Major facilitator superfamily domain-containing protein n=1 Tax=Roridomyces roridus TaxID=1738132 RepID=A0AAD7BX28_9AGAR|nr:major facilitator superfamily domain-containing protein [Roridomyces roridus]
MDSSSENSEKRQHPGTVAVRAADVDVAAHLMGSNVTLEPEAAARLRRKIDWHLMPLMCLMYLMTFADKTTLGQAAVLGLQKGAHLNQNQFNWLGSIFYFSYLLFEYPQNLALQRFPVGKWMSINIFVWAVALMAHSACKSFGALFACRFILGLCEGAITPGFMIVTSMFYTREEQNKRVGYWFLMNGFAVIFLGFVAFGVLHTNTHNFMPWQWLMIITGAITLVVSVIFWFFFPDSPTTARFLTIEERILAVERVKVNQAGIENKHWKRSQFISALKDHKIWLLAAFAALSNITNSLIVQRQIIVKQFGFTPIQTTLLGCVDGVVEILTIWAGVVLAGYKPIGRAYAGVIMFIPAILGAILVNTLPSHNKVGLLFSYWLTIFAITPFAISLGWLSSLTAGHTRRTTANAIMLVAYGLGNAVGPFMWKAQYQPRNHVPWAIITACSVGSALLLVVIRFTYAAENKRRDTSSPDKDNFDEFYIAEIQADGTTVEKKVDRAFLDLTDIENKEFRYVL